MGKRRNNISKLIVVIFVFGIFFVSGICSALTIKDSLDIYKTGKKEYTRGNYSEAIDSFKKVINDCPETAITEVAVYYMAQSYKKSGDRDMAIATFKKLIDKYRSGKWVKWARQELKEI